MERVAYRSASGLVRRGINALWPAALLSAAIILIPDTMSYARGSQGPDLAMKVPPPAQPGWSDRAAKTLTAAMVGDRHPEHSSLQVGSIGFFYTSE
jgi:hypothetical protein